MGLGCGRTGRGKTDQRNHGRGLLGLILLALAAGGNLPASDPGGAKEETLALPKVSVTANVPLVKVAEYHMHEGRAGAAAVLNGWYVYIIGGQSSHGNFVRMIERLDVRTGETKAFSALVTGRLWLRTVAIGSKIYIFGGESFVAAGKSQGDVPRAGVEQSAEARLADVAKDHGRPPNTLDELHPEPSIEVLDMQTGAVSLLGKMPDPRSDFGCVSLDGLIYVIGGKHSPGKNRQEPVNYHLTGEETVTNRVDVFNPGTGAWTRGVNMPVTSTADACVVDGRIICAGGYNGSSVLDSVLVYDPKTSVWSSLPPLSWPRSAHSTVRLGKYLFLFGDYNRPDEILAYNLRDKTSAVFTLRYEASRHAAAVANAKRIFVIGGKPDREAGSLDTIQVFQLTPEEGAASRGTGGQ